MARGFSYLEVTTLTNSYGKRGITMCIPVTCQSTLARMLCSNSTYMRNPGTWPPSVPAIAGGVGKAPFLEADAAPPLSVWHDEQIVGYMSAPLTPSIRNYHARAHLPLSAQM